MRIAQKSLFVTMLLLACFVSSAFAQENMGAGRLYNPNTETTVKGTVEKIEVLDAGREKFVVNLTEYDREYMGALRSIFSQRQAEIEKFLEEVRG